MDALRTGISAWGAETAHGLAADGRSGARRDGDRADRPGRLRAPAPGPRADRARPVARPRRGFLYQLDGVAAGPASARALDAYFIVGAEHGFNASTFTALVITSTKSDLVSGICGAIGALKGPLHGGAPSEVVDQLNQIGTPEHAEAWLRDAVARGERLMGFGHRVYKAYDPRAAALRKVAEGMSGMADWLDLAVAVEDVALRVLAEMKPDRHPQDQCRVLRGGRPAGRRPAAGPLPGHVRARPPCRLDGALHRVRRRQSAHPAGRRSTPAPRSDRCPSASPVS